MLNLLPPRPDVLRQTVAYDMPSAPEQKLCPQLHHHSYKENEENEGVECVRPSRAERRDVAQRPSRILEHTSPVLPRIKSY